MKITFYILLSLFCLGELFAQNVGIGTNTPAAKLDVIGSIKISDGTQGSGKVLTSDANGLATWQALSSGPPSSDTSVSTPSVWIGCNPWMTMNLDVATYRNGDPIPHVTDHAEWASLTTGAYCYYQNDSATYAAVYGKLYNWYAVNDPRGLAPTGWHIPSDHEWTTLINTLGGGAVAGGPMKDMGTAHWATPNLGATNVTNFAALPGGTRHANGSFTNIIDMGKYGHWWSASRSSNVNAWSRRLNYLDTEVIVQSTDMNMGYYVRCIRD